MGQAWLLIGIPTIALATGLFLRPSGLRAAAGYAVLAGGTAGMAVADRASAAALGGVIALIVAAGRGTRERAVDRRPDEEGVPDAALHPKRRASRPRT